MEIVQDFIEKESQKQRQTLETVDDFACEAKNLKTHMTFRIFCFFYFSSFLYLKKKLVFSSFFIFLHFSVVRADDKTRKKHRRTIPIVKMTTPFAKFDFWGLGRKGPPLLCVSFLFFPCFSIFVFSKNTKFLHVSFFLSFLQTRFVAGINITV